MSNHFLGVTEQPDTRISFHAVLTTHQQTAANTFVRFQQKSLDTADGIYTVPESGHYVFTWTVTTDYNARAATVLMVNSRVAGKTVADADEVNDLHTSTGIIIANVSQGVHVFVQFGSYFKGRIGTPTGLNSFSGWKLD